MVNIRATLGGWKIRLGAISAPAVLCAAAFIAGCGGAGEKVRPPEAPGDTARAEVRPRDTSTSAARDSTVHDSTVAASPDTAAAAWTAGITETDAPADLRPPVLRAVRAGRHEGFDRVVFTFEGGALPGHHLEYIDAPVRQCGSGRAVPLQGDGRLEVRLSPAQAHTEDGEPSIAQRARVPDLPTLEELKLTCDFEGVVTWVLGLAAPNRYRVLRLRDPLRLVVDVRH